MYFKDKKLITLLLASIVSTVVSINLFITSPLKGSVRESSKYAHRKTLRDEFQIDFYQGMKHSRSFNYQKFSQEAQWPQWQMLNSWYETATKKSYSSEDPYIIPNSFHLIWLGGEVPERYATLAKKLKELHPNAQVRIWTDKDVEQFEFKNRKAFDYEINYGAQSDVFRYEILYKYGGIYLDGDFELLKSLSALLRVCSFFAGMAYNDKRIELYNGLIACTPGHPVIKECLESIKSSGPRDSLDAIIARTGPGHFTECVLRKGDSAPGLTVAFPVAFFYPWPNYERHNTSPQHRESFVQPYSFTMHHWARSWVNSFKKEPAKKESLEKPLFVPVSAQIIKKAAGTRRIQQKVQQPTFFQECDSLSSQQKKNKFVVVTLTYNNEQFCEDNLLSTLNQDFPADRYRVIIINDNSNDRTEERIFKVLEKHPRASLVTYVKNSTRRGGMANYVAAAYMCDNDEIIIHVDGDDRLIRKEALSIVDQVYTDDIWLTYGSYVHKSDGKLGYFNGQLPERIIMANQIRYYDWTTSHLRTFRAWLFKRIRIEDFMYGSRWLPCCTDLAIMWPLIEMAGEKHIRRIETPIYEYNDTSQLNLYKVARGTVLEVSNYLKHKQPYARVNLDK